jgi:hypothetical protein
VKTVLLNNWIKISYYSRKLYYIQIADLFNSYGFHPFPIYEFERLDIYQIRKKASEIPVSELRFKRKKIIINFYSKRDQGRPMTTFSSEALCLLIYILWWEGTHQFIFSNQFIPSDRFIPSDGFLYLFFAFPIKDKFLWFLKIQYFCHNISLRWKIFKI